MKRHQEKISTSGRIEERLKKIGTENWISNPGIPHDYPTLEQRLEAYYSEDFRLPERRKSIQVCMYKDGCRRYLEPCTTLAPSIMQSINQ